jgi:hypothetical protein
LNTAPFSPRQYPGWCSDRTAGRKRPRVVVALLFIVAGAGGCASGFPDPNAPAIKVSVSPASATVAAGSITSFAAVFPPDSPGAGSLTWSVAPSVGGTITSAGVYTASATPGEYTVTATWRSSNPAASPSSGSATVDVLPPPQIGAELNTNIVQASGSVQASGGIQGVGIVGQQVPSMNSADPSGNVRIRSGFAIPTGCSASGATCP